jgi:hypothetical protein
MVITAFVSIVSVIVFAGVAYMALTLFLDMIDRYSDRN